MPTTDNESSNNLPNEQTEVDNMQNETSESRELAQNDAAEDDILANEKLESEALLNESSDQTSNPKIIKIAVIGSGIGGASATHFLRYYKLFFLELIVYARVFDIKGSRGHDSRKF